MKVLVTGANGFIGRPLVSRLSHSHEVFAVVRRPNQAVSNEGVSLIAMDLACPLDTSALPAPMDVIIHLAQADVSFPEGANELFAVNTSATQQLLDYGRRAGARQFIMASSGDVYGQLLGPCKETDAVAPASFYAITKYAAELLAQSYSGCLRPCILRFYQPYGPGQANRLIPRLAGRIRRGDAVQLHKEGRPHLTPIYIDDAVTAIERAVDCSYSGVANIAGDRVVSIRELVEEIGSVLENEPILEEIDEESADMMGCNELMKQMFGAWPMIALTDGLLRTFKREEATKCQPHV